ncbi:MAG: NAD(P)H-hydrate dehydratase [Oscillospiraceae bacterium]|nr:NAD(P)H-hydrate dehydratase [Oscillospiraceae bacterium]
MKILSSSLMKKAETIADGKGCSYGELMENAGTAAAKRICRIMDGGVADKHFLILCGRGNNAGDGLVIARHLLTWGADVTVLFLLGMDKERMTPLCRENLALLNGFARLRLTDRLPEGAFDAVIDGVFGTGFSGCLPENVREVFAKIPKQSVIFALDIPSGINCDNGFADENVLSADYTFSFGAPKPAHILKRSALYCGKTEVLSIGIEEEDIDSLPGIRFLNRDAAAKALPKRQPDSHKGSYGKLLNIGGCSHMTGALMLSTMAALAGGTGLCKVAAPETITHIVAGSILSCIHAPLPVSDSGSISCEALPRLEKELDWATALVLGCGMSVCEDTVLLTETLLQTSRVPMVLDADAINCLSGKAELLKKAKAPVILTPHMLEMSRLSGYSMEEIQKDRFRIAEDFAREYGVTLVLKDSTTVVASPDGVLRMLSPGYGEMTFTANRSSGLAKGGSGDILAGLIGAMISQGASPEDAAVCGVWLHGRAADLCEEEMTAYCMQPVDVLRTLPAAFKELL